jgi:hypothetical protein
MPGRKYQAGNGSYRYGFNGQEKSTEINDALTTAEFWEYDSRIGRRWNVDPVTKEYESPYLCLSGNPILFNDPNGDDAEKPKGKGGGEGQTTSTNETKFVPSAGARGGTWQTKATTWTWHSGGIKQDNGKVSEAGWYNASEYSKILTPLARELAGYKNLYSAEGAGHNWTGEEKQNVANSKLGNFVGTGLSDGAANALARTAETIANQENHRITGFASQSSFNVEDMIGVGLLVKELSKGSGKFLLGKLPQGGASFEQYKMLRGGTETLEFIKTTNKEGQVVLQRISVEFSHTFITQRTQKAMGLPNWLVNNRINVWRLNTVQHALIDPFRRQFLRAGFKSEISLWNPMKYNWFSTFPK